MTKSIGFAVLVLALGGCVYSPTPGPSVSSTPGGYTLNDNGYQAYYTTKYYPPADCRDNSTDRCRERLDYDSTFCANWSASGKCGDSAATSEPSNEIAPLPPGGPAWTW